MKQWIGVDGCKGGWIAAVLRENKVVIKKYESIHTLVSDYPEFDELFIDMVIGLPSTKEHIRPDSAARKVIKERASTIFPVPCRQAVYASTVAELYDENVRILGKKFTPLTVGIIPKMRELDEFLQANEKYKNKMKESHPEVCFSRLNKETLLTRKVTIEGQKERIQVLSRFVETETLEELTTRAKKFHCKVDDIIDAICLAVCARLAGNGEYEVIPEDVMEDETGLLMQMTIPRIQ